MMSQVRPRDSGARTTAPPASAAPARRSIARAARRPKVPMLGFPPCTPTGRARRGSGAKPAAAGSVAQVAGDQAAVRLRRLERRRLDAAAVEHEAAAGVE